MPVMFKKRHYVESVQIQSYFLSVFSCIRTEYLSVFRLNTGKYGTEITSYLDTFQAVRHLNSFARTTLVR